MAKPPVCKTGERTLMQVQVLPATPSPVLAVRLRGNGDAQSSPHHLQSGALLPGTIMGPWLNWEGTRLASGGLWVRVPPDSTSCERKRGLVVHQAKEPRGRLVCRLA